jgi:hypothetical protein
VVIRFIPPEHNRSLAGVLKDATYVRFPTDDALRDAIADAWVTPDTDASDSNE